MTTGFIHNSFDGHPSRRRGLRSSVDASSDIHRSKVCCFLSMRVNMEVLLRMKQKGVHTSTAVVQLSAGHDLLQLAAYRPRIGFV